MKNEHMLPQNIIDLVSSINNPNIKMNEKQNYIHRLEVIRDYCNEALDQKKPIVKK